MNIRLRRYLLVLVLALSTLALSAPSYAEMSSSQAAAAAKQQHGGKVLNVQKVVTKNGKVIYKVKLLLDGGRVKTVTVSG